MATKKTTNNSSVTKIAAIGAGIASVAAASYFFLGPKGKKHQKHARSWVIKMKGDIIEKLESARDVSEPVYHKIVDAVAEKYAKGMKATSAEVSEIATDLKKHWKTLQGKKSVKKAKK
jgi:hypothetical protein